MIPSDRFTRRLSTTLNICGVGVVGYYLTHQYVVDGTPGWAYAAAVFAVLNWLVMTIMARSWKRTRWCVLLLMVVCSAVTAAPANGVAVVPAIVALVEVTRDPRISMTRAGLFAALAGILAVMGSAFGPIPLAALLSIEAGFAVAFLVGFSRRQHLVAEEQSRELRESALAMREEQAVVASLAARQAVARDIHDLLAHSLGGLVIQLDAVEALLEDGDVDGALSRARDARSLAADGLSESRRAVVALRHEAVAEESVSSDDFMEGMRALVAAHRSLRGEIDFTETGVRHALSAPLAGATHRAFQESLTNARKHAAQGIVTARLEWSSDLMVLTVENDLDSLARKMVQSSSVTGASPSPSLVAGGGHGLIGMRERFLEVPGGSATAGVEGPHFVVRVRGSLK